MAVHVQLHRGTTAQNDAYTGLEGEITVDTTTGAIRVHDGKTKGAMLLATQYFTPSQNRLMQTLLSAR